MLSVTGGSFLFPPFSDSRRKRTKLRSVGASVGAVLWRGLHDAAGHLIGLARPPVRKQWADVKGREKKIFNCRWLPSCMQVWLLFETMRRKWNAKFSKQPIDQAYAFLHSVVSKGWKYFWIWTLPSQSEGILYLTEKQNVLWSFILVFSSEPSSWERFPFFSLEKSRLKRAVWLMGPLAVCECGTLEWRSHDLWMIRMELNMFAQNVHQIILNNECRC